MEKEFFMFKKSWRDAMEDLPKRLKLKVYDAVVEYALTGEMPEMLPMVRVAFCFIKLDIDAANCNLDDVANAKSDAVGDNPAAAPSSPTPPQTPSRTRVIDNNKKINNQKIEKETQKKENEKEEIPPQPSLEREGEAQLSIEKENELQRSSESKKEKSAKKSKAEKKDEIDPAAFILFFNQTLEKENAVIPHTCVYTDKRATAVKARARENGKESLKVMAEKAAVSDFLNGRNGKGWVASLDWMLRPNNFIKVIEGNYDNDKENSRRGTEATYVSNEEYARGF